MTENKQHEVSASFVKKAYLDKAGYQALYKRSIEDPAGFWGEQAEEFISWFARWDSVKSGGFEKLDMAWFTGGKLNACHNCLDRHLDQRKDQTAIIWEGDNPDEVRHITYSELHREVCRFANVLKNQGVKKGDRVCIYLPMIPEAAVAMLACARIGAIHSVVFAGFSSDALKARILDAEATLLITADEGIRGGKTIPIKKNADTALMSCPGVKCVIVVKRTGAPVSWDESRDVWYHEKIRKAGDDCPVEIMDAMDPLFILYTSGSTGKPKGVLHVTGGYLVYAAVTHHYIFDYHEGDIYWCTADVGWITGHSYIIYGPLANGATTLMFEGAPNYPTFSRFWEIIDRHQVNIFYTAPTAIRALRREGDEWVTRTSRKSLTLLGTVGEPINPDVWEWYYQVVGEGRCPIVDTWWQTETGGVLITPLPGATLLKPGSASWPFLGIEPAIVDERGETIEDDRTGHLVIRQPWPGLMHTIYRDHQRFIDAYFKESPGNYLTGDGARRDKDGYYWISGRDDDVIKVSGHRLGTEELESAFIAHPSVSEAAVVGIPHEIKGQAIYAYITTKEGVQQTDQLNNELIQHVRSLIGPIATPEEIQWADDLPKTRSGKIMRRILRKIASNELNSLGDTSTLANPGVVDDLIAARKKMESS
ncbi:Acetyl-coenzyme A synthetase [Aquicella siphonis]|uniref:Acetyl-coenzyme A synthetase n=1 Tax=Aquicella siphonis TaxID=254247 RepID=A0A5E4PJJ9_9COXI|nr:acetate--CoA ligase [Aquicella siphonis]VVC76607.1 Acetyl-coenzyme A synthetase [Aquicella siphonis]